MKNANVGLFNNVGVGAKSSNFCFRDWAMKTRGSEHGGRKCNFSFNWTARRNKACLAHLVKVMSGSDV